MTNLNSNLNPIETPPSFDSPSIEGGISSSAEREESLIKNPEIVTSSITSSQKPIKGKEKSNLPKIAENNVISKKVLSPEINGTTTNELSGYALLGAFYLKKLDSEVKPSELNDKVIEIVTGSQKK